MTDSSLKFNVTELLEQAAAGDRGATDDLFSVVYRELHQLASAQMNKEAGDHTLQSTALVHEVWIKLIGNRVDPTWKNGAHFFAAAAQAMRRILVDSARARHRAKRGGGKAKQELRDEDLVTDNDKELLDLDVALEQLREVDQLKATLVELRFFAGLTNAEAAEQLGISTATAERYWAFARAWLRKRIEEV